MQFSKFSIAMMLLVGVMAVCLIQTASCQQGGNGNGGFGSNRPAANVIFEPTLSFIRQNMRLVQSYIALFRSIFVGAYDRPLVTSTDGPNTADGRPDSASIPKYESSNRRIFGNSRRPQ